MIPSVAAPGDTSPSDATIFILYVEGVRVLAACHEQCIVATAAREHGSSSAAGSAAAPERTAQAVVTSAAHDGVIPASSITAAYQHSDARRSQPPVHLLQSHCYHRRRSQAPGTGRTGGCLDHLPRTVFPRCAQLGAG